MCPRCASAAKTFRCWRAISWSVSARDGKADGGNRAGGDGRLEAYDWPGNVRELENTMERAVALETGPEISVTVLPERIALSKVEVAMSAAQSGAQDFPEEGVDFEAVLASTEKRYLQHALEKSDGVRTRAAELLKISYRSFRHYAKKHEL